MRSEAWRPAAAACNRLPREVREAARQALRPGARSSLHGSGGNAGDGSAAPGEKPPRWSAERRASRVMGRKAPRKRLACRVMCRLNGCPARTRTSLGAPPTPQFGVSEAQCKPPGRRHAPRERDELLDIVSWAETRCCPHPEERACASASAKSNECARVSKDEDGPMSAPSCFETHRSALRLWEQLHSHSAAMLLSMRARAKNQPAGVGNDRQPRSIVSD